MLPQPVQILYVSAGDATPEMIHARTLVVAGDRSESRIVETFVSLRGSTYFTNAISEFFVGRGRP